jgi:hypothetical protein
MVLLVDLGWREAQEKTRTGDDLRAGNVGAALTRPGMLRTNKKTPLRCACEYCTPRHSSIPEAGLDGYPGKLAMFIFYMKAGGSWAE